MSDIEKVDKFLTDAEVFYLASVTEENKPKCRPILRSWNIQGSLCTDYSQSIC